MRWRRGFTLVEMLVVIAIIAALAAMIMPALVKAKERAKIAECTSNLRQLSTGIQLYQIDNSNMYPLWLTQLEEQKYLPKVDDTRSVFVCPSDETHGKDGGRPGRGENGLDPGGRPLYTGSNVIRQFTNADKDGPRADGDSWNADDQDPQDPQNSDDPVPGFNCSYLFEFNGYKCEWMYEGSGPDLDVYDKNNDGVVSWYEAKVVQVDGAEGVKGYGGVVPVVRCYWHATWPDLDDPGDWVSNIRWDFAVKRGRPQWELDYR